MPGGTPDEEHRKRAGERDGDAPPERRCDAEEVLTGADDPLAERRVDDEVRLRPVDGGDLVVREERVGLGHVLGHLALVPVEHHRPALLDVIRLVEHELVRSPEIPQA